MKLLGTGTNEQKNMINKGENAAKLNTFTYTNTHNRKVLISFRILVVSDAKHYHSNLVLYNATTRAREVPQFIT
jgi:hypothetical protein